MRILCTWTEWQIALRREKPGGRTISSPPQEVSKLDSIVDEDEEISSSQPDVINTVSPVPKDYDPAPDVRHFHPLLDFREFGFVPSNLHGTTYRSLSTFCGVYNIEVII